LQVLCITARSKAKGFAGALCHRTQQGEGLAARSKAKGFAGAVVPPHAAKGERQRAPSSG
jgi:hypothetical protein